MITQFNKKQKRILKEAAQIQIETWLEIATTKSDRLEIKNKVQEWTDVEVEPQVIMVELNEAIQVFKNFKKDPNTLFTMKDDYIGLVGTILSDFFDHLWDEGDEDFLAICKRIVMHEDHNLNNINPN